MNFYFTTAKTLDRIDAKNGSIKSILSTLPANERKRISALTIETLKFKPVLVELIQTCKLLKDERKITSMNLALVLVHDLLFAKGIQAGDGPVKQAVLRHKTRLKGELQKLKIKRGVRLDSELSSAQDERAAKIPRYARINTNTCTHEAAIKSLLAGGYAPGDPFSSRTAFALDEHIPNLVLFHPQAPLRDEHMYKDGRLILQDKASCMPAVVLDPPATPRAVVIDATAAPGNKTSHLSALMKNQGKLMAFERDRKRFTTLEMMLAKAKCTNVQLLNVDFLTANPEDPKYAGVTHILLDPSCSGSGIVNRMDYLTEQAEEETDDSRQDRLAKLSAFQLSMCKHAMKFPAVKRIVYSTCSIHAIENEQVVIQALASDEAKARGFILAPRSAVLEKWPRRGLPSEFETEPDLAESVVRCSPDEDATNGFFVSCFIRPGHGKEYGPIDDSIVVPPPSKRKTIDDEEDLNIPATAPSALKKRKKSKKKKTSMEGGPPATVAG